MGNDYGIHRNALCFPYWKYPGLYSVPGDSGNHNDNNVEVEQAMTTKKETQSTRDYGELMTRKETILKVGYCLSILSIGFGISTMIISIIFLPGVEPAFSLTFIILGLLAIAGINKLEPNISIIDINHA
jgi:hypothetical protein